MAEKANWRVTTRKRNIDGELIEVTVERLVQVEGTDEITYVYALPTLRLRPHAYELVKPLFDGVGAEYVEDPR